MPSTFYEVVWIFLIYAMIGWCAEVAYAALDTGRFVNRGFLNGPYCPIYGCGILLVIVVLTPLKSNLAILYFGSVILTTVIEYITGFLLEKVFHNKWWDYSDKPFNIKGYICLKFSLMWGFACTFIVLILHPILYSAIKIIPFIVGIVILSIIVVVFAIDCGVTVATILNLNQRLKRMNDIADKIHKISDELGENIYENVTEVLEKKERLEEEYSEQFNRIAEKKDEITENITEKTQEVKLAVDVRKMELEKLKEQYSNILAEKKFGETRLMKAFPRMTSNYNNEMLQKLKNYMEMKKRETK